MKRLICWLALGAMALFLCCCGPAAPATAEQPLVTAAPKDTVEGSEETQPDSAAETAAPQATPTASPVPTVTPTPTPTPTPTSTPIPTPTPTPTPTASPEPTPTPVPRPNWEIVEEMAVNYAQYGARAEERISALLAEMGIADPGEAQKWTDIMGRWRTLEAGVTINLGELPEGLPDTDELCIVALGYQLNDNGSMKKQLQDRLKVVKKSAKKYPNAWVLCTGGHTASRSRNTSEAGKMSTWLRKNGVSKKRIITEKKSRTTVQNAQFSLDILLKDHPEIKYLAIVSGDYHIKSAVLFFEAEAILLAEPGEEPRFTVISNAACKTSKAEQSPLYRAGGLVELAGNEKVASRLYNDRYDLDKWPPLPGEAPADGQTAAP